LAAASGSVSTNLTSVYRSLGGGWQIREGDGFVGDATRTEMRDRTNWGSLLPPASQPQAPVSGLPGPDDKGPNVQPPKW